MFFCSIFFYTLATQKRQCPEAFKSPRSFSCNAIVKKMMKLIGYSPDNKENSFREPIYKDSKGVLYRHEIDARHNITAFKALDDNSVDFHKIYLSKKFNIGSKSALVFVGKENYLHYDAAPNAIEEVIHYLNDHSSVYKVDGILDHAMLLKNRIFSDHFVVDNFVVKMNPDDNEQIILSFDFPSPKKESFTPQDSSGSGKMATSPEEDKTKEDDKEAIFSKAIKQLNSVDMNFELKLKLRAEERRSKLKTFNYQFKLNQNSSRRKKTSE